MNSSNFKPVDSEEEGAATTAASNFDGYDPEVVQNSRGVRDMYFKKYGVMVTDDKHIYPFYDLTRSKLVGLQERYLKDKSFRTKGSTTKGACLFGAQLYPPGSSKEIIVCEGALDAISACQMVSDTVPCVSFINTTMASALKNDTGSTEYKKEIYEYLNSFETIILALDNDAPGKQAANDVASIFPGKVKIMQFPEKYKDANDFLVAGDYKTWNIAKSKAILWVPDGIVRSDSTYNRLKNYKKQLKATVLYPWEGLNDKLCGIRRGEIVTFCSGTGQGKSTVLRELLYYLLTNTTDTIGAFFLEEPLEKTELHLLAIELGKMIFRPDVDYTDEEYDAAYNKLLASGRLFHHDHFGSTAVDNILKKITYMALVAGCKYVFLDHISILVSSQENGDERKAIDETMTKLRMLVEQTGICVFLVTHLSRQSGSSHEEGGQVSLSHLRGSNSIGQISDSVVAMERNQQAEDPRIRNTTLLRVLKCRLTGDTGPTTALYYDKSKGRLEEVPLNSLKEKDKKGFTEQVIEDVYDNNNVNFGETL